jgi:hypothetical protein
MGLLIQRAEHHDTQVLQANLHELLKAEGKAREPGDTSGSMKFSIEILRISDNKARLLHRVWIEASSPEEAMAKAVDLLDSWRHSRANGARVRNQVGNEIYLLR